MSGGCATLTNLGGLGIGSFTPILVPGQAIVLGVGRMKTVAKYVDEHRLEPRKDLPLSLSFDHRLLDGADGARFIGWLASALEDPWSLILEDGTERER
jgi:pyruvate dehydrogenase E2 component (dihydrolipoamide acetyltransferase)